MVWGLLRCTPCPSFEHGTATNMVAGSLTEGLCYVLPVSADAASDVSGGKSPAFLVGFRDWRSFFGVMTRRQRTSLSSILLQSQGFFHS